MASISAWPSLSESQTMSKRRKSGQRSSSSALTTATLSASESDENTPYSPECSIVQEECATHVCEPSSGESKAFKAGVTTYIVAVEAEDEGLQSGTMELVDKVTPVVEVITVTSKDRRDVTFSAFYAVPLPSPRPQNKVAELINAARNARNALAIDLCEGGVKPATDGNNSTKPALAKYLASSFLPDSFEGVDIDMAILIAYLQANDMLHFIQNDGERVLREGLQMRGPLRPFLQTRYLCAQFELAKRRQRNQVNGNLGFETWKLLKWAEGRYAKLARECNMDVVKDARYYLDVAKMALDPMKANTKSFCAAVGAL